MAIPELAGERLEEIKSIVSDDDAGAAKLLHVCEELLLDTERLKVENDKLRKKKAKQKAEIRHLKEFAQHISWCHVRRLDIGEKGVRIEYPCNCGLEDSKGAKSS